jgi:hypothetical protein
MNLKYLGDALDHWKGAVIDQMGDKEIRVVPMLTDKWDKRHIVLYAGLLRVDRGNIVKSNVTFSKQTRGNYFRDLGNHDLFVDPDTGVWTKTNPGSKHIGVGEIGSLLHDAPARILLIYQNRFHKKNYARAKLDDILRSNPLKGCHAFAYYAGAVSMIVVSRNHRRFNEFRSRLKKWLGPVAHDDSQKRLVGRIVEPGTP